MSSSGDGPSFEVARRGTGASCGAALAARVVFSVVAAGLTVVACGSSDGGIESPPLEGGQAAPDASQPGLPAGDASASDSGGGPGPDVHAQDAGAQDGSAGPQGDASVRAPDGAAPADGGSTRDATTDGGAAGQDAAGARDGGATETGAAEGGRDSATIDAGNAGDAGAPGVRIVGRTTTGTAGPRFEWSGVNIAARFTGTQASIQLDDASNLDEFEVVVDGTIQPNLVTRPGATTYALANGLANGTHDLLVCRRTEASYGFTELLGLTGFSQGGALLAPSSLPAHQMEVIGDSISCGFGIEGNAACTTAQLESIENNYLAYGSVAARALAADVVTVAWSGIGVYRNYNEVGPSTNTMPQRYDFAIPTTSTAWDFSKYQPQAVVINLTSNDFSTMGDPGQPYIDTFVAFVQHIRSKYPGAYLFLVIEWRGNGSDSGPDVNAVVSTIRSGGDTLIESFDIRPFANGNGCQGHPDVAGSQAMGNALAAEIKRVLSW